ncbi:GNAT family N-acetyltransferase [Paenibacillus oleatilyticus]|uniref:GNAT family N-acetyltransferase n=1 Tax=Paenibacillus oleatilyticus TaxID=2594886 RepID=UPI001C1F8A9D|nr:GNAT family N-acetyltransferase [Paenibacillus oleatilyticus]MBU7315153.1 GNAT family N-acetyltransferase [Paenibacillus oleatilyticus]
MDDFFDGNQARRQVQKVLRFSRAQAEDESFLYEVYASSRIGEVGAWGWGPGQIDQFLRMQYRFQQKAYSEQYPEAAWNIVWRGQERVGRRMTAWLEDRIVLVDVALLPAYQRQGIGTSLLQSLQQEAQKAGKPLWLSVQAHNPARRLYERLGFRTQQENGLYCEMIWQANTQF